MYLSTLPCFVYPSTASARSVTQTSRERKRSQERPFIQILHGLKLLSSTNAKTIRCPCVHTVRTQVRKTTSPQSVMRNHKRENVKYESKQWVRDRKVRAALILAAKVSGDQGRLTKRLTILVRCAFTSGHHPSCTPTRSSGGHHRRACGGHHHPSSPS